MQTSGGLKLAKSGLGRVVSPTRPRKVDFGWLKNSQVRVEYSGSRVSTPPLTPAQDWQKIFEPLTCLWICFVITCGYGQVCRGALEGHLKSNLRDILRDILRDRDIWAKLGLSRFGCFLFVNKLLYVSYYFKTPVWINNSIFFSLLYYFYLRHIGLNLLIIAEH